MVDVLDKTIEALKKFEEEVEELVIDIAMTYDHVISDMNTEDQLYEKGINSYGTPIISFRPYAPLTIQLKREKGQPTDRVTLRDEGDFHRNFYVKKKAKEIEIGSTDSKAEELEAKYGSMIYGLTKENLEELETAYIKPDLQKEFAKITEL